MKAESKTKSSQRSRETKLEVSPSPFNYLSAKKSRKRGKEEDTVVEYTCLKGQRACAAWSDHEINNSKG